MIIGSGFLLIKGVVPPPSENTYLETVTIPTYDSGDSSHLLITEANGKWTSTNLNSSTYKHFYVEAGDYSSSSITLTVDGTENDRRSISLYNGNDTHPASLATEDQADIRIVFNNADYWDIDRMSFLSTPSSDVDWFYSGSSYNTLNRIHIKDYYYGIRILHLCHYNTIQNSYFNEMTLAGRKNDNVGLALTTADQGDNTHIYGTKVINNDFKNANDAFQAVKATNAQGVEYDGTVIDSNRMWVTTDTYTDGSGNHTTSGLYSYSENAIDIKAGSDDENNEFIVTNNMCWGYRKTDATDSSLSSAGSAINIHFGAENIKINSNIIFDSNRGIVLSGLDGFSFTLDGGEITNNILHDVGFEVSGTEGKMLSLNDVRDTVFGNNTFVQTNSCTWIDKDSDCQDIDVEYNVIIDCGTETGGETGITADHNHYYDTSRGDLTGTNDVTYPTVAEANMADYYFEYERFTTSPKNKTLTDVCTTSSSPHYGVAGSDIDSNV